jgi:hypothetical protein
MDFLDCPFFKNRFDLLSEGVKRALEIEDVSKSSGMWLEFGVFTGETVNHIARLVETKTIYGFDSFEGLPEDWRDHMIKGFFSTDGIFPEVEKNVTLIKGWFNEVLPGFIEEYQEEKISFLHIDCDLYSSAKEVLTLCNRNIQSGTVICFDEFYNYDGWENYEYKAWTEYCEEYDVKCKYLGRVPTYEQVLLEVL